VQPNLGVLLLRLSLWERCRLGQVSKDMDGLIGLINSRKPDYLDDLVNRVGWERKGPSTQSSPDSQASVLNDTPGHAANQTLSKTRKSKHVSKYTSADCSSKCLDGIAKYYKDDFALLQYPRSFADL
jgi:hypothetical protein